MTTKSVTFKPTQGMYKGLAKQNLLFHQCICELVDNGIAASKSGELFKVKIHMQPAENMIGIWVSDQGKGMSSELLEKALTLGESATTEHRLNEHGYGLKNALATLSGGEREWSLWTKDTSNLKVTNVRGPFSPTMEFDLDSSMPSETFISPDANTVIYVPVPLDFVRTVQGKGKPANNLTSLSKWLIEHLGVIYRGYLEVDKEKFAASGAIWLSTNDAEEQRVHPIPVPYGQKKTERFSVSIAGISYDCIYYHGVLDETLRDKAVQGREKAKYYYQGNRATQGIDIQLGKRVIATQMLDQIWGLERHNNYNEFVGELVIPDLPRGVLSTVNNKTDFNIADANWDVLFTELRGFKLVPSNIREQNEAEVKNKWADQIRRTSPHDIVTKEQCVWPTNTKIDVLRKTEAGKVIIYEMKVVSASPIHLYQLKMYWDGLVLNGDKDWFPSEAVLVAVDFTPNIQEMANRMNKMPALKGSNPYSFSLRKLSEM